MVPTSTETIEIPLYVAESQNPHGLISTIEEALRDKWIRSMRKTYGKNIEFILRDTTIVTTREVKEDKPTKEESS